jgi:hypothetical protein
VSHEPPIVMLRPRLVVVAHRVRVLFVAALLFAGCVGEPPPNPQPGTISLPSDPTWRGSCNIGVGREAVLAGSASDPRVTWGIDQFTGARLDLLWPVGYTARFGPGLEVVDDRGVVVARAGDLIIGSCLSRPQDAGAIRIEATDIRPPTWQPGDG